VVETPLTVPVADASTPTAEPILAPPPISTPFSPTCAWASADAPETA